MRIVWIVTVPISAWIFLDGQLRYFRDRGYDVQVISSPGELLDRVSEREGVPTIGVPIDREVSIRKDIVSLWRLYRELRRLRPDVTNVGTPKAGLLGGVAAVLARVPWRIYTMHGLRAEGEHGLKRVLLTVTEWVACRTAHRVVFVSPSLRQRAIDLRLIRPHRGIVLGSGTVNGVNADRFAPTQSLVDRATSEAGRFGMDVSAPVIGYVGRLTRDKGVVELCAAYAKLRQQQPEVQLLLVGWFEEGDPLPPETCEFIDASPGIICAGFVDDVAPLYHLMDVFVLPTYREGFPTTTLEAAAAGVPVVTTTATGAIDSVDPNITGLIVPVADSYALANALGRLLGDPEMRADLGCRGRDRAIESFAPRRLWEAVELLVRRRLQVNPEPADSNCRTRVLLLIKSLGRGGAESLFVNHVRFRSATEFDYEAAYVVPWLDDLASAVEAAGVPVTCLHGGREWDIRWAARLYRFLVREGFHVVHVHSPYVAAVARLVVRALPQEVRPKVVYTEHNQWPAYAWLTRIGNHATYQLNAAVLAVSENVRRSIPRSLRGDVETLIHGVDVQPIEHTRSMRQEVRNELGVTDEEVLIGIVANFRPEKAYSDLLTAAAKVIGGETPVRFVSVGHGPLEEEARARHLELGLGDRFRFLGYREDAVRVMSSFDIFTLASVHEGLPVVLMEALALGLPIVATSVGGVPEAVTGGVEGVLVPPSRPDELAAALEWVAASHAVRQDLSAAALTRSGDFDVRRAVARVENIYREVALR